MAEHDEALEERLGEARLGRLLADDHGAQLSVGLRSVYIYVCVWLSCGFGGAGAVQDSGAGDRPIKNQNHMHARLPVPTWQWSPTMTSCLAPITMGMRLSGSIACVASSTSTCLRHDRRVSVVVVVVVV